jgi:Flp pilus assembly protein TadD
VKTPRKIRLAACAAGLVLTPWSALAAPGAEIVLLQGKGERRAGPETAWVHAAVRDQVGAGGFVRTLADSQMALLMSDRTQVRLNQNSLLQIKSATEASQFSESTLRLNSGRAWSQARPQAAPAGDARQQQVRVRIETPTATIGIRGTDWDVEVEPDGRTRLVLLSGNAEIGNEHGSLTLAPGEAALAEAGKAPVRFQLVNPASRVQWVSAWRPQPRRWGGDGAARLAGPLRAIENGEFSPAAAQLAPLAASDAAAARLLADVLVYQGELARAGQVLAPHVSAGRGDPLATALLAHVMARQDRLDEAQALLQSALAAHPGQVELLVASGDLAVLQGDAVRARQAYSAVLALQPRNVDAWYGLGVVASERERVAEARAALANALRESPGEGRAQAELAAAETFADNLPEGQRLLLDLLQREPSNYQALTALGLNRLKGGQTQAALEDFMRAGVIEPRYSRAWLYSGVAFYQLGERDRAEQAFNRAAQLDARDPIPHLLRSIVENDALDPGAAIASAREAQQRMPFLRSLNQVASNQKGSANLGSALAGFGLEEWAGYYATRAYSPYWGGSHLFLADRYTGQFNKNSELYKGFLTEPTAFGASNRQSSLVTSPGHYGSVEAYAERTEWDIGAGIASLNGLVVDPVPVAYFASADVARGDHTDDPSRARYRNLTVGLGVKPHYQLGVFAFATDTHLRADLRTPTLPDDRFANRQQRADLGLNFKVQPDHQLWLKAGVGKEEFRVNGTMVSQSMADSLNQALLTDIFTPSGTLDAFGSKVQHRDLQLRHTFTASMVQWTWGLERSRQDQTGQLTATFAPVQLINAQELAVRATDAYLSARVQPGGGYEAQLDLFAQRSRVGRKDLNELALQVVDPPIVVPLEDSSARRDVNELNPRLGFQWELAPLRTVRAALQRWRRPASAGTLAPVDTVGIALNDRLVLAGGLYERARLQYDGEHGRWFLRTYADYERVDNGPAGRRTAVSDFEVTQLEKLRTRPDVFAARSDLEENPFFTKGRVESLGGAANVLLSRRHAVGLRYVHRNSRQDGANAGLRVPFVPRHYFDLASQWSAGGRWLLGATATWRSGRYKDDTNLEPLRAGWELGLSAYWESADRRSVVQAAVGNILSNRQAGVEPDTRFLLRYAYRF